MEGPTGPMSRTCSPPAHANSKCRRVGTSRAEVQDLSTASMTGKRSGAMARSPVFGDRLTVDVYMCDIFDRVASRYDCEEGRRWNKIETFRTSRNWRDYTYSSCTWEHLTITITSPQKVYEGQETFLLYNSNSQYAKSRVSTHTR